MENKEIIEKQTKVINQQKKKIDEMESTIKVLAKKLANTTRTELAKEVDETRNLVKKEKKFNVKAWLIASAFAICSCIFGIVNLILNLTRR